jgi:hypothetical protein
VEEPAKRALEPWVSDEHSVKPCKGDAESLRRPYRAFHVPIVTQGCGRFAAFALGFAASRFQRSAKAFFNKTMWH